MIVIKKLVKNLFVGICIFAVVFVVAKVIAYANRPYSPSVSIENIQRGMSRVDGLHLVKANDHYYTIEGSHALAKLFVFDEWEQTQKASSGKAVIAFCLAEEWIIDLHSDGSVTAYDGYASSKHKSTAYYAAPAEMIAALSDFIAANGELQEGRFLESAFYH